MKELIIISTSAILYTSICISLFFFNTMVISKNIKIKKGCSEDESVN